LCANKDPEFRGYRPFKALHPKCPYLRELSEGGRHYFNERELEN
jgi:hypothetical protein